MPLLTAGPAETSYQRPKPQAPHPGDQLANVMSNDRSDALFMDPSWADPDLGGPGRGMGMGQGGPPRLAQPSLPSMQSSAAADPFSQLSLSRGSSGECHTGCLLINLPLLLLLPSLEQLSLVVQCIIHVSMLSSSAFIYHC